jgi:hypothetical protein
VKVKCITFENSVSILNLCQFFALVIGMVDPKKVNSSNTNRSNDEDNQVMSRSIALFCESAIPVGSLFCIIGVQ